MENIFLMAMELTKASAIQQIKANKQFALMMIKDLTKVFRVNQEVNDSENSCIIRIKGKTHYIYQNNYFVANSEGVFLNFKTLGHYKVDTEKNPTIMPLGELYEKYKGTGSSAESSFLDPKNRFGYVTFRIPLDKYDALLHEKLRDVVYLLEHDRYNKVF